MMLYTNPPDFLFDQVLFWNFECFLFCSIMNSGNPAKGIRDFRSDQ